MAAAVTAEPDKYSAFGTKDKVRRLRIRSAAAPVNAPGYNILLNVVYDERHDTHFILVYSILMVLVRGRNLQKMVFAIENEMADYIQEFDADRWQKPADAAQAFIESIEIRAVDNAASGGDVKH
jgi:hypothetical protein